jgi:hypothetical protein
VFSSGDATSIAQRQIELDAQGAGRTLALDLPELRDYFVPMLPGNSCALIGQSSNFKTGLMRMWINSEAERLTNIGRRASIISIHTEETLEDVMMQEVVRVADVDMRLLVTGRLTDLNPVKMALSYLGTTPIIRIAYSNGNIPEKPTLNMTNIARCVAFACKTFEITDIAGMWLDYLQAMANEDTLQPGEDQFRIRVRNNVFGWRRLLQHYACAGVLGVQATTDLRFAYSKTLLIPGLYDGQETSAIGQHSQRVISVGMPKMWPNVQSPLQFYDHSYKVTDDLVFIRVCKQQGNLPSGKVFVFKIDYKKHWLKSFPWNVAEPSPAPELPGLAEL